MAKKVSTSAKKYDEASIRDAIASGDSDKLSDVLAKGYNDRTVSINPQIQKSLAKVIMDLAGYEPPEEVRTSTNSTVQRLDALQAKLEESGQMNAGIAAIIASQKEEASTQFIASDGIQKGWQAFVIDCVSDRLDKSKLKKEATALRESIPAIVDYGAKRAMTADEKKEYDRKKAASEDEEEEELEE